MKTKTLETFSEPGLPGKWTLMLGWLRLQNNIKTRKISPGKAECHRIVVVMFSSCTTGITDTLVCVYS